MQAFFEQNPRHVRGNAEAEIDRGAGSQLQRGAARNHLLRPPCLQGEAGLGAENLSTDRRIVNGLRRLPLFGIDHDVIHQRARHVHLLRLKRAGTDYPLDLGDDYAAIVARGQSLVECAQKGAFMLES
jgi:hypothetical protein